MLASSEPLWGVAISSHQNDGGAPASDWTMAERARLLPVASGLGADFRRYWRDDLDRLKDEIGANAFRFSVEWARVEPEPGRIDPQEMDFLLKLLEGARDRGLAVILTLHHFTSPNWLHGLPGGGWEGLESTARFERYTRLIAREFGQAVRYWLTFNEPTNLLVGGYLSGRMPPFRKGPLALGRAARHLVLAHERAYEAIHDLHSAAMVSVSEFSGILRLGVGLDYQPGHLLDGLRTRGQAAASGLTFPHLDYIGLHYYGDIPPLELIHFPLRFHRFPARPEGFGRLIRQTWARYRLPILIGENGLATRNHAARPDGWTSDRYLEAHVAEVRAARTAGIPILGYCWWTLTDNYEWGSFDNRFGLYRVECASGDYTRHATPAVAAFRRAIRQESGHED
ncbi:MAG: family 1 glycosylhydrolase [Candidatus Sericytochromatia bacterium]|nr:family 1 glycosylhydrolase [Candidatus Sericytochromatia bacterium]